MLRKNIRIITLITLGLLVIIQLTNNTTFLPAIPYVILLIGALFLVAGIIELKEMKKPLGYIHFIFSLFIFLGAISVFITSF